MPVTIILTEEEAKMVKLICCDYINDGDFENLDVSEEDEHTFYEAASKIAKAVG
ncbi:MAG: hypothetical protein IJQ67_00505 [Bacilli bacterium]|nr:hypothetical protein [Bacilli bacterium]